VGGTHRREVATAVCRLLVTLATVALASGCSVNDLGLVRVRHLESDSARVVRLDAWGLQILTRAEDAGLTLGPSERMYVFPKATDSAARLPLSVLVERAGAGRLHPATCDPCPGLRALGSSLAWTTRTTGIRVDANGRRIGVMLGLQTRAALRLPLDAPTVLLLKSHPNDPEAGEVYIAREAP